MEKRPCLRRHAPSQKKAVCHPASLSGSGICFHPSLRNMPGIRGLLPCEGSCRGNGKRLHESDERQDEFGRARRPGALARGVAGCHGVSRGVTGSALHTGASEPGGSFGRVAEGQGPLSRHQEPASAVRVSVGLGSSARQALEQSCVRIPPLPLASCALVGRLPRLLDSAPYRHFQASVNSGKIRE